MSYSPEPGSIEYFVDELKTANEQVADLGVDRDLPRLRVYRLREDAMELPAIYSWLSLSPLEWRDAVSHRNRLTLNLAVRIIVGKIDSDELATRLMRYADCARDVLLPIFRAAQPLNNASKWADMPSLQFTTEEIGDVRVPAVEFAVSAWIDRNTTPTP